ncbi:MAG: hypothetical protein KY445_08610 [Armatimonadetes bacterium]|nr:hypothetical protein [Armatimonadota bacterium]
MPSTAILFGALLFALGPIFFFLQMSQGDSSPSPTAFIPSLVGIFIIAFGLAAKSPSRRKAAMHGAAGFALLGLLGSLMGARKWPALLSGGDVDRPLATWEQLLMFLICTVFLALCVKSFAALGFLRT